MPNEKPKTKTADKTKTKTKTTTTTDTAISKKETETKPERGRGGKLNFPNARMKEITKTDEGKKLVGKLLNEVLVAYHQEKVKSDEELSSRLANYFQYCADNEIIPTMEEMAMWTGYTQTTVFDWISGKNKGFSSETSTIIKKAKELVKTFDAKLVTSGKLNPVTYFFRAKNYYGMSDTQKIEITPTNNAEATMSEEEIAKRLLSDSATDVIDVE